MVNLFQRIDEQPALHYKKLNARQMSAPTLKKNATQFFEASPHHLISGNEIVSVKYIMCCPGGD